jgi:hypothetical protein
MTMRTVHHLKVATITHKVIDESEDGETKDNNDRRNSPPMVESVCLLLVEDWKEQWLQR